MTNSVGHSSHPTRLTNRYLVLCVLILMKFIAQFPFQIEVSMKHADKVGGKNRDSVSFHRLLVISLQILTVLLSLKKAEKEEYKFRKVNNLTNIYT